MFIEQTSGQTVKIKFDINEKQLLLGDIVKIIASGKDGVLAQVLDIYTAEKTPNYNVAEAKILFTIESSGKLLTWQGNLPSQDYAVTRISEEELLLCSNITGDRNSVPLGTLSLYPETEVRIDSSLFEQPTVVYCDKQHQKDNILSLLACDLSKGYEKTVLIDFNNDHSDLKVSSLLEAGKDIKLPLNLKGLELLYSKTLANVSPETRAVIEDIFIEIENYLSSGDVGFIPFSSFRQAVNSVCESNKITELVLLKNKLLKLAKFGIFADKAQEINHFSENIQHNNLVIVDFSKIPAEWQGDFVEFLIDSNISVNKQKFFLLLDIDKINVDKSFIEKLCGKANKSGISPVIVCSHESALAVPVLSYTKNIIAFAPQNLTNIASLKQYLLRLKDNEAIVTGNVTNNIPLFINVYDTEEFETGFAGGNSNIVSAKPPEIYLSTEIEASALPIQRHEIEDEVEDFNYSSQFEHDESEIELVKDISNLQEEVPIPTPQKQGLDYEYDEDIQQEPASEEDFQYDDHQEDAAEHEEYEEAAYSEEEYSEEKDEEELPQESEEEASPKTSSFYDEFDSEEEPARDSSEPYDSGFSDDDLANFLDDDTDSSPTEQPEEGDENFDYDSNEEFQDESVLDYTDFVDEGEEEEMSFPEEDAFEEISSSEDEVSSSHSPAPNIPVYSTPKDEDETEDSGDEGEFQAGDKIQHPKYGTGSVVKIIGTSEKKLVSVQFDDVGRRLLDPKLSGIQKIG